MWALTPNGAIVAGTIGERLTNIDCHIPAHMKERGDACAGFEDLKARVSSAFWHYEGHIFIMATGIVVRIIAPLIKDKTVDPAVVVLDEKCNHCISLVSGHLGGANELARQIAQIVNAVPVITTATDVNNVPSIDLIAKEFDLAIENPEAIKIVNMALLERKTIEVVDPYGLLKDSLNGEALGGGKNQPMIYVGDEIMELPPTCLVLRPRILVAGIGCNRGTGKEEIKRCLYDVFRKHQLSPKSLCGLATIDIKKDEAGLIELAEEFGLPIMFYSSEELNRARGVQSPSKLVKRHIGVESVCEGAALLGAKTSKLLVPKQAAKDVTVAVARTVCM